MLELNGCKIGVEKVLYTVNGLQIDSGKLTVLIGANGAGKSTLLDAIALGQDAGGTIRFNGRRLGELTAPERSKIIALVESRFAGADYLSTREYLELGRFPHTGFSGRLTLEDHEIVAEIANQLSLEHLLDRSTARLSDGERQRASIARALIQQTPVILLDEPTSFLDYPNKRAMMRLLQTIAHTQQKLVLLASHDLELCLEFSDDCLVIHPATATLEKHVAAQLHLSDIVAFAFPDAADE